MEHSAEEENERCRDCNSPLHTQILNGANRSGYKTLPEKEAYIAAFKALRHPKASFSANCKACSSREWTDRHE